MFSRMLKNQGNPCNKVVWAWLASLDLTQINFEERLVLGTFETSVVNISEQQILPKPLLPISVSKDMYVKCKHQNAQKIY